MSRVWHGISAISRANNIIIPRRVCVCVCVCVFGREPLEDEANDERRMANGERYYEGIARMPQWAGATTNSTRLLLAPFETRR